MGSLRTISPAPGVYGSSNTAEGVIIVCTNGSGGSLQHGDVVIMDPATAGNVVSITTTTTAQDGLVFGVVQDPSNIGATVTTTYASGAAVPILVLGAGRINVGAGTPAARDFLTASGTAKVAVVDATPVAGEGIARCIHATKDANNCVVALIAKM